MQKSSSLIHSCADMRTVRDLLLPGIMEVMKEIKEEIKDGDIRNVDIYIHTDPPGLLVRGINSTRNHEFFKRVFTAEDIAQRHHRGIREEILASAKDNATKEHLMPEVVQLSVCKSFGCISLDINNKCTRCGTRHSW